jgi:hypothetical protein
MGMRNKGDLKFYAKVQKRFDICKFWEGKCEKNAKNGKNARVIVRAHGDKSTSQSF